ncbi:prion-inhibition and propagation-domain-containing protein, partial [Fusarium avenaceum]
MEAVGLAVGLVGIFSTCLEAVQRIDSYKTAGRDTRLLRAQLNATMHLFERWGDSVGIGKGKLSDNHHPALDDPKTFSVIKNLLESFEEFSAATTTHDATSPNAIQRVPSLQLPDPPTKNASKASRWQKTSWALRGKLKQTNHVEALATLVSELYTVVSPETAVVASVGPKPLATTDSLISQHDKAGEPCDVRGILLELQQELKAEALQKLRAWLGSPPPNHVYTESKYKRLLETCEWILHRQEFLDWQAPSASDKLLWIKGPAGFGKTVLCARLVDEVEETTERPMAYFFLSSKFEGRDDPFSAIRSWLTTVISKNPVALDTIRSHPVPEYEQVASQTTILQLFHDVVLKLPGCTFILDGLDECTGMNGTDSKSVTCFLEQLRKAISNTGTRLLITSRGDPIIQQGLSSFPGYTEYSVQAADVGPDLAIYSSEVVEARLSNKDEATREFIAQKIKDRCQGQFQWIKLQEGSLRKGRSKRQLEREIDETPSGLDGLYDREWSRIMAMGAIDTARALCLLRWAAFSMRPLTVYEITEAALMTENCERFPHDEMPDSIDKDYVDSMILDLCGSLIEVRRSPNHDNIDTADLVQQSLADFDLGLQEVHLTHFSVKEYLLRKLAVNHADLLPIKSLRVSLEQLENMALSKYCIRYLNLPGAWDNWQMDHERSTMRFLSYAATFWVLHYKMAETPDSHLRDESNAFFDTRNQSF